MKAVHILVVIFLNLGFSLGGIQPNFNVQDGAYEDLLVTISPDVPESQAQDIIDGLQVSNLIIYMIY